jgi:hypothetical protein
VEGFPYNANSSFLLDPSPKRRIAANPPLHKLSASNGSRDINFSRKREPTSPLTQRGQAPSQSKRHKRLVSEPVKQQADSKDVNGNTHGSHSRNFSDRLSKFEEASMRDRPSAKPPSMFLRSTRDARPHSSLTVDQLMEDYHRNATKDKINAARRPQSTQFTGLTHHPNESISSNATTFASSNSSKDSGLSRFGKSIQSINPVSLWHKYRESKENLRQNYVSLNPAEQVMVDRQIQAEQAYAAYKREGRLGNLGSKSTTNFTVYASGYAKPGDINGAPSNYGKPEPQVNRHSLDEPSTQRISAIPSKADAKKFHIRTPSMQDLKRIASGGHRSRSASPEKQQFLSEVEALPSKTLYRPRSRHGLVSTADADALKLSPSKKDLAKQVKLNRRISDLEAKLQAARRQLYDTVETAPPLPLMPSGHTRMSTRAPERIEPLPTLFSDSLLPTMEEEKVHTPGPPVPPKSYKAQRSSLVFDDQKLLPESPTRPQNFKVAANKNCAPVVLTTTHHTTGNHPNVGITNAHQAEESLGDPTKTGSPKKTRPRANVGPIAAVTPGNGVGMITLSNDPRSSLETVAEERMSLSSNSFRIPANSSSRVAVSDTKSTLTAAKRLRSRPSFVKDNKSRFGAGSHQDLVTVRPDGIDVPPVPMKNSPLRQQKQVQKADESFEWPEDVF